MSVLVLMCVWNSIALIHTNATKVKESKVREVCRETKTFLPVVKWKVHTVCDHTGQLKILTLSVQWFEVLGCLNV